MISRNMTALLILLFLASSAQGATWERTVDEPDMGEIIPVVIGEAVLSIESVRVRVVGYNKVGGYSCDGVPFPEYLFLEGTFGQEGTVDDMQLMTEITYDDILGPDFDVIYEFDLEDVAAWAFLADGTAEFTVSWWRAYQDVSGYCTHLFSSFILDSITLSIDYNGAVPVVRQTWGTLKATYRD